MLKELLAQEKISLDYFFDHIDLSQAEGLVEDILACKGVVVFTGVGKSGLVAEKIAVTMASTGSKAIYLSPTNALHGDMGMVDSNDIFVILSKSGESDELLTLIPAVRNKGAKIVAIISNDNSRLAKASDTVILLPLKKELCPFNLVPTTSTTIQMIFGDLLSIAIMSRKNFSLDQYALNHPAGRIGKRITLRVRDLMLSGTQLPICDPQATLQEVLVELSNKKCGCIMVANESQQLQGIFTDGDLRRALQAHGSKALEKSMGQLMVNSAKFVSPDILAWDAMQLMEEDQKRPITVLPVLKEDKTIVGILKMHDIIQSGL
jgi:arabinose-5-phosphate isomerase